MDQSSREESTDHFANSEPSVPDTCPECGSEVITDSTNEVVCEGCGLVIEDAPIDRGPDWRSFSDDEEDKARVGAPTTPLKHDKGLSTRVDWETTDAKGQPLSSAQRDRMSRLRLWQNRLRKSGNTESNLDYALNEITRMGSALDVPDQTEEMASVIYRRALNEDLIRGRSIEGIASAAFYIASVKADNPLSLDEVTSVSRVDRKEIARSRRYLSSKLNLEIEPTDPRQFIPRFTSELDLDKDVERKAMEILESAIDQGLHSGKSPSAFAAGAIYGASLLRQKRITQYTIANVLGVSPDAVRDHYRDQLEALAATVGSSES